MHIAAGNGHVDVVNELVTRFPTLQDIPDSQGRMPIHVASEHDQVNVVRYLLDKPCCLESRNSQNGETPYLTAAKYNSLQTINLLFQRSANGLAVDSLGQSAVHLAAINGHLDVVKAVVGKYPQLATTRATHGSLTPYDLAVQHSHSNVAQYLAAHGNQPQYRHQQQQQKSNNDYLNVATNNIGHMFFHQG